MVEEGYSGYENWETWNVSLWLSNDEGLYNETKDILLDNPPEKLEFTHIGLGTSTEEEDIWIIKETRITLSEFVDQLLDDNIITDKISIHRVNWKEVIEGFGEELAETNSKWKKWLKQSEKHPEWSSD